MCSIYDLCSPKPYPFKGPDNSVSQAYDGHGLDYGILAFYCPTSKWERFGSCYAIVQGARYLGTILLQPIAAHFIEVGGYQLMSFFLAGVVGLAFLLSFALKMPQGKVRSLFNGTAE